MHSQISLSRDKVRTPGNGIVPSKPHTGQEPQRSANLQGVKLCVSTLNGFQVVSLDDIICCEANGPYSNIHLSNGKKICASRPLMDYEILLSDNDFIRVHKSFLINAHHVQQYIKGEGGVVVLSSGMEVEVSRRRKEQFMTTIKSLFKM